MMPSNQAQTFSKKVKIELIRRQLSVSSLAKRIGIRRDSVSRAISGSRKFPRIAERIRKELDL